MTTLTTTEATALYNWINENAPLNWGSWSAKPTLSVGATYLQYDNNPCVIKLDRAITLTDRYGDKVTSRYISYGRSCPAAKGNYIDVDMLAPADVVEQQQRVSHAKSYDQAKERQRLIDVWNSTPADIRQTVYALHVHMDEIVGTPGSRKLRAEIQAQLNELPYMPVYFSNERTAGDLSLSGWMAEAMTFATKEEYVDHCMSRRSEAA